MTLTVLNVAYPLAPVGPDVAGGAEQVLSALDGALIEAGHRSIVLACEGSAAAGELRTIPVSAEQPLANDLLDRVQQQLKNALDEILRREQVDVVHLHGIDFYRYLPAADVPVLTTLHLPIKWYPQDIFYLQRPATYLNCVSSVQQRDCPAGAQLLTSIENGVAVEALRATHAKRSFALTVGRICPEKGLHLALSAAAKANLSLLLCGELFRYESHERYFFQEIAPRLDRRRRFIGRIGFKRKRRLLTAARCLLMPSLVAETSSLVAMEALACGTPVIGFRAGALTEIIEDGKTGFLVDTVDEMADAIAATDRIDPQTCRETARVRFSAERMTAQYLEVYTRLSGKSAEGGWRAQRQKTAEVSGWSS